MIQWLEIQQVRKRPKLRAEHYNGFDRKAPCHKKEVPLPEGPSPETSRFSFFSLQIFNPLAFHMLLKTCIVSHHIFITKTINYKNQMFLANVKRKSDSKGR